MATKTNELTPQDFERVVKKKLESINELTIQDFERVLNERGIDYRCGMAGSLIFMGQGGLTFVVSEAFGERNALTVFATHYSLDSVIEAALGED